MNSPRVQQRKVWLPVVDASGKPLEGDVLDEIDDEYRAVEDNGDLTSAMISRIKNRGETLDYGRTLLNMVKMAKSPRSGMSFDEMESVYPIIQKLKHRPVGGHILVDEAEFKIICEKVKLPFVTGYNELFHSFVKDILASQKVALIEEAPNSACNTG